MAKEAKTQKQERAVAETPRKPKPSTTKSPNARNIFIVGFGALFALIPILLIALSFFEIDGAVVAPGTLIIEGKPKVVQHLDGGIVREIHLSDGDFAEQGDLILKLDDVLLSANIEIYSTRLRTALAKKARLNAEREEAKEITWDNKLLDLLELKPDPKVHDGEETLFEARRATLTNQLEQLDEQEAQLTSQIEGIGAIATSKANQIRLVSQELDGLESLLDKGNTTLSRVMLLKREHENMTGERAEQEAEIARIRNVISEKRMQATQLKHQFREAVLTELQEVDQEINDMTQQLYATKEQLKRTWIKAPVSGIIHGSNIHTVGGVIEAGQVVMNIIPQDFKFVIEARIETQFVDNLYAGQPARIRFTSFNQRQTPELQGEVQDISASTFMEEQTGLSYYIAKIRLNEGEEIKLKGKRLISGMMSEVYIRTESRSIASYFIRPFKDQMQRAMREE